MCVTRSSTAKHSSSHISATNQAMHWQAPNLSHEVVVVERERRNEVCMHANPTIFELAPPDHGVGCFTSEPVCIVVDTQEVQRPSRALYQYG